MSDDITNITDTESGDMSFGDALKAVGQDPQQTELNREDWRTTHELKSITFLVQSLYQIQALRIGLGNRIYAHCVQNLGVKPSTKVDDQKKAAAILKQLMTEYKDITTALVSKICSEELVKQFNRKSLDLRSLIVNNPYVVRTKKGETIDKAIDEVNKESPTDSVLSELIKEHGHGLIRNHAEFQMARMWDEFRAMETGIANELGNIVTNFDIWNGFLSNVKGIGPTLASCLISTINMEKCYTVQSLWKYCGLDVVVIDGIGVGRNNSKEQMEMRKYIAKDGTEKMKLSLTYNPWIKTKIMGTMAGMFMKMNPEYRAIYDDIKLRLNSSDRPQQLRPRVKNGVPVVDPKTGEFDMIPAYPPARINMMSQRYMMKMFLLDYWVHSRIFMGLPMKTPYVQEKLGYQCKFRTFIKDYDGKYYYTRIAFNDKLDLAMLKEIQKGPVEKYVI